MTTHPDVQTADTFADEANAELADLIDATADTADALDRFTAGSEINVDRLALDGTAAQLEAWRSTRLADARWRELLARWRDHWTRATGRSTGFPSSLRPKGLDLYLWERPEDCDHETVRLGATHIQRDGIVRITPVHVDLVRVAQQDTPARLLGPTAALELIGPDGIVQEAHPLRVGTRYAGAANAYRPTHPTWIPPKPEPQAPTHNPWDPNEHARWLNRLRDEGTHHEDGSVTITGV